MISIFTIFMCVSFAHAGVRINEVVYDAPGADTGHEWVELYNAGSSTVSLEGWALQVDENRFPGASKRLCGSIAPGGYYLIKETAETISSSVAADWISGTLAMGNASSKADGLQLVDAAGGVQDRVVYGGPDTDALCGGRCSTAPVAVNGAGIARSTPGADAFVMVSSSALTPQSGGGRCALEGCPPGSGRALGWMTEVAPSIPGDDFVEIYLWAPGDLCGVQLYEGAVRIKTFPSVTPRSGPFGTFVVLHAGQRASAAFPDDTDDAGDRNGNGVIDLYSDESSPGLTATPNNNLTLKNADGTTADFLSWSLVPEDTYAAEREAQYDAAVSGGRWSPSCGAGDWACRVAGSVAWYNRTSESMARRMSAHGRPQCSSPPGNADWQIAAPTPGRGYESETAPSGAALQVFQSPFSPLGEGRFSEARIVFQAVPGSVASIRIFSSDGRLARRLAESLVLRSAEPQSLAWDGRDDEGRLLPAGAYLALFERHSADGTAERDAELVILARRLD